MKTQSQTLGNTHVVNGVLEVKDAILQRVADVIFRVAGWWHLFIKRAFDQFLVLQHSGKTWVTVRTMCVTCDMQSMFRPTSPPPPFFIDVTDLFQGCGNFTLASSGELWLVVSHLTAKLTKSRLVIQHLDTFKGVAHKSGYILEGLKPTLSHDNYFCRTMVPELSLINSSVIIDIGGMIIYQNNARTPFQCAFNV